MSFLPPPQRGPAYGRWLLATHRHESADTQALVHLLADQHGMAHARVSALSSSLPFVFWQCLRSDADVIDLHGATVGLLIPFLRMLRRSATIVSSLHEPGMSMTEHLGTRLSMRYADEVVATEKTLQYALYERYRRLPTYIPDPPLSVPVLENSRMPSRTRHILFVTDDTVAATTLQTLERACMKEWPTALFAVLGTSSASRTEYRIGWDVPERDHVLQESSLIIVATRLSPAALRTLALAETPILALDSAEHREALGVYGTVLTSFHPATIRRALQRVREERRSILERTQHIATVIRRTAHIERVAEEYAQVYQKSDSRAVSVDSLVATAS